MVDGEIDQEFVADLSGFGKVPLLSYKLQIVLLYESLKNPFFLQLETT